MRFSGFFKILFALSVLVVLQACGGGGSGNTNGALSMTDITATASAGGEYSVQTTATYVPAEGKDPQGLQINFVASFATSTQTITRNASITVGSSGTASVVPWKVTQSTEPVMVTITASVGGLHETKTVIVPALSASP